MQHGLTLLISTNKKYLWPNMQKRIPTVTPFSAAILNSRNQEIIDFLPPRTDGSRHNHRPSLLHKRIGYCTSITIITGSDCSSTSQQNLHKTVFPKCSFFIEAPAANLFLPRRKLKHKHHLNREFLDQVTTDSAQFISEPLGLQFFLLLQNTRRNKGLRRK